ncbi:speckle-type POZ protein B-like [Planococcus citri]|uniref:speckle-type POZ protein B-like n=1 Tax=Planococcus citri TaxID=170843 RepID=UPI0031F82CD9
MSNCTRNAEIEGSSNYSMFDKKTCSYFWTIHNYSYHPPENRFKTYKAIGDDFKWRLKLFRDQLGKLYDGILIRLCPHSDDDLKKIRYNTLSGNLKITLMGNEGRWNRSAEDSFELGFAGSRLNRFFDLYICGTSEMNELAQPSKLFVWCHIEYKKKSRLSESSFSRDLERIRIDEDFSDVTISVNGKNYPAHKVILAAHSSVFKVMFKNDMQESQKNYIIITDMEQETFEEMLHYIYTGEMRKLDEWAFELLPVANKYDLKELKIACEELLLSKISADNVGKILVLADMHNAEELKANALRFIKENYSNCGNYENTEMWKILTESRPTLMKDMLAVVFEK